MKNLILNRTPEGIHSHEGWTVITVTGKSLQAFIMKGGNMDMSTTIELEQLVPKIHFISEVYAYCSGVDNLTQNV
jgi:hypothetical protein